ncbi:Tn3 family transposase [Streptomyces sp. NPDC020379]|uniref:Tn3 family transposase n=1 Tax=Streptomyces sp. NPDC020379 TaxID=3365071 RepID=UPI0037A9D14F
MSVRDIRSYSAKMYGAEELGRAMRMVALLRFLLEPELCESIQSMTNKVEALHKSSNWLRFASDVLRDNGCTATSALRKRRRASAVCAT